MKVYKGRRTDWTTEVRVERGGVVRPLPLRNDLRNGAPAFEWGYPGSGPNQLALALAADVLGDDDAALKHHERLKPIVEALSQQQDWELSETEILVALP